MPRWGGYGRLASMCRKSGWSAFVILICSLAASAADGVQINHPAPAVEHKRFDPKHPPSDMPPLEPGEAAVTRSIFEVGTEVAIEIVPEENRNDKAVAKVTVTGVTLNLSLKITVWLPKDAPKIIIDHEEGHRQVSEYFYKDAEKIGREIAQKYVGQTTQAQGKDAAAAGKAVMERTINEISQRYMEQVQGPAVRANRIFDELTNHSRNQSISAERATKQSIERARKEKK